jgi:hypothetical protein
VCVRVCVVCVHVCGVCVHVPCACVWCVCACVCCTQVVTTQYTEQLAREFIRASPKKYSTTTLLVDDITQALVSI